MINAKCSVCGKQALFIDPFHPYHNEYTLCGKCVRVEKDDFPPAIEVGVKQRKRENREALIKLCWVVAPVAALAVVLWMKS